MHQRWLFIFRQDIRIQDNVWLYHAAQECKELVCLFVFDDIVLQQSPSKDRRLGFLINALQQLDKELQSIGGCLYIARGSPETIIPERIKQYDCDVLYCNRSYGPRSQTRDKVLQSRCREYTVVYKDFQDFLLVEPHMVEQRKVFTPFYNLWKKHLVATEPDFVQGNYSQYTPTNIQSPTIDRDNQKTYDSIDAGENIYRPVNRAQERIQSFNLSDYETTRNNLDIDGTTRLSPYMRFGLVSIRQLFQWGICVHKHKYWSRASEEKNHYISELAWREFWYHIMYYFPETAMIEFQEKRRHINRSRDPELLYKREMGQTGYPIVDAAMHQLRTENRMHGRARMIVASFLTKDMLIDWRLGEKVFSKYLIDYDFAVNIWNRQWSASVWADPKPLRIFNPILQSQKFDPQLIYINKYIPELQTKSKESIHDPISYWLDYIKPIVDHYVMSKKTREVYKW
jgi:deoxyribodipyrimidine photo-lyase